MSNATHCFAAICSCGGWRAVAVDVPEDADKNEKEVIRWKWDGYQVRRVSLSNIRSGPLRRCECWRRNRWAIVTETPKGGTE